MVSLRCTYRWPCALIEFASYFLSNSCVCACPRCPGRDGGGVRVQWTHSIVWCRMSVVSSVRGLFVVPCGSEQPECVGFGLGCSMWLGAVYLACGVFWELVCEYHFGFFFCVCSFGCWLFVVVVFFPEIGFVLWI
jgi:hypothetical protein